MAGKAPDEVLDTIKAMPDTKNVHVHEDFADAALAMPADRAAQMVPLAIGWLESPYQLLLPEKLAVLMQKLASEGQVDAAFELAEELLDVRLDELPISATESDYVSPLRRQAQPRFRYWLYERILKDPFAWLVLADPERALKLLCDKLEKALRLQQRRPSGGGPDYSYIWRPAIEDHAQNIHREVTDALVTGIRNSAELVFEREPSRARQVLDSLESRPYPIFHRLALHLMRCFPSLDPDRITARLTDRSLFDDHAVHHEYFLLVEERFGTLPAAAQDTMLKWIDEGPDLERFKDVVEYQTDQRPSEEEAERYRRHWQLERLTPLQAWLSAEWRGRYEALFAEFGSPAHTEFRSWIGPVWTGPTSPKTADDLRDMSVQELVSFMREWQPPKQDFAPSPEGLRRELTRVVAADPNRFAAEASSFKDLDPTYVHALLDGFREGLKENNFFDWSPVLDLCTWVIDQPRDIPGRALRLGDVDPDWGWTRKAIAALLSAGFQEGKERLPFTLRQEAWAILEPLTDDPEPTPEYEAKYGGSNMDPATLSINTTRGEAMHAVARYALWCYRHLKEQRNEKEKVEPGFDDMPEVRAVLKKHLDTATDPSLAVRSVYGQWLPWLALIDSEWVAANLDRIFPKEVELESYRDVAWGTYVIFCRAYDSVFDLLEKEYQSAVKRIGAPKRYRLLADPDGKLAVHLMALYWRGKLSLDDPEGLLNQFWTMADDGLRGNAIAFMGQSLAQVAEPIGEEVAQRLVELWQFRVKTVQEAENTENHREEMSAFGWWLISKKLDRTWALEQLLVALELSSGKVEPSHQVLEILAEMTELEPNKRVTALAKIVQGDPEGWVIYGSRDSVRTILGGALQSMDQNAKDKAKNLVHYLGAMGHLEYRDLLKQH